MQIVVPRRRMFHAGTKLPIILYFHGAGFVVFSADTTFYHASCEAMAAAVPAIVASLDYRLAPEHRLPAAYDDAVAAILWLRGAAPADPWIAAHGDISRCFVMGSSSGGNMAFNAGVWTKSLDLSPVAVRGLILHQPYLGGVERTPSEAKSEDDFIVPLEANDKLWSLALPVGVDRDHDFANPMKALAPEAVSGLPRCLVSGSDGDPLIDRQRDFVRWLQERGVEVVAKTEGAGFHTAELFVPEKAEELFAAVREFVYADDGVLGEEALKRFLREVQGEAAGGVEEAGREVMAFAAEKRLLNKGGLTAEGFYHWLYSDANPSQESFGGAKKEKWRVRKR